MFEKPLVSICIPVFNGAEFIEETLLSVINQTYGNIEIVIVDNQSTDNTIQLIKKIEDSRIKLYQNETNIGLIANWNMSMSKATGKYIKILPADDTLYPTCIEKQVAVFEKDIEKTISLVCCKKHVINETGKIIFSRGFGSHETEMDGYKAISKNIRSGGNIIGEGAPTMFRKEILEKSGYIDTDITLVTDLNIWFKILRFGNLYYIPETLATFRICKSSNSVLIAEKQKKEYIQFISQIYHDKSYKVSYITYKIGVIKAGILSLIKKMLYKYVL